ncbi:hypothetical protein AGMMS50233_11010 [Endomicrobiia bacterium]|nr:hypothetical protein AGMMS50233_11010 [Endomicrobiia bacterium]
MKANDMMEMKKIEKTMETKKMKMKEETMVTMDYEKMVDMKET